MIGKLNHIAIVVADLGAAARTYREQFGARVSKVQALVEHGVSCVFVELPNTKIELLHPLGEASPIGKFLERHPGGGMHHICYEVTDLAQAIAQLQSKGARVLGDGQARTGAHGKPVVFLHPGDFDGTLIELEEI